MLNIFAKHFRCFGFCWCSVSVHYATKYGQIHSDKSRLNIQGEPSFNKFSWREFSVWRFCICICSLIYNYNIKRQPLSRRNESKKRRNFFWKKHMLWVKKLRSRIEVKIKSRQKKEKRTKSDCNAPMYRMIDGRQTET